MTETQEFKSYHDDGGCVCRVSAGRHEVIFGRWEGGSFVVSHAKPSKTYKTSAGAGRAISRWLNGRR